MARRCIPGRVSANSKQNLTSGRGKRGGDQKARGRGKRPREGAWNASVEWRDRTLTVLQKREGGKIKSRKADGAQERKSAE